MHSQNDGHNCSCLVMHLTRYQLVRRPSHARAFCASSATTDTRMPTAYVYAGEGAGSRSVLSAMEALQLATTLDVQTISTEATLQGHWTTTGVVLVMPGGADLPYCRRLNGIGNNIIQGVTARVHNTNTVILAKSFQALCKEVAPTSGCVQAPTMHVPPLSLSKVAQSWRSAVNESSSFSPALRVAA